MKGVSQEIEKEKKTQSKATKMFGLCDQWGNNNPCSLC